MIPTDRDFNSNTKQWSYQDFQQALIGAATQLSALADLAEMLGLVALQESIGRMLTRLSAGSFSVAVVGEFKRGKTTFINALLGHPVLPADAIPCSATLTRLVYARAPRAEIHFRSGEVRIVELVELDRYITQVTEEAAALAATVRQAVVAYPTLFCQNNVTIIDTPGLSDTEAFNRLVLDVVPHSDAAVFVVSASAPFSETERNFLLRLLETLDLDCLLFVVNRIDQIGGFDAADRVVALVRNRIAETVIRAGLVGDALIDVPTLASRLRVFGLSAHFALQAKLARNAEWLAASRLPDFEQVLEQFLVRDRGVVSLKPALKLLSEGGQAVLAVLAAERDSGDDPMLDPWQHSELDAIVSEALSHEHQLPERIAIIRPQLTELAAALEQGLIEAAHDAITEGWVLQDSSLKPNELEARLSAAVECKVQQVNQKRQAAAQAVLDSWIAEEMTVLDALGQRLAAVAARLSTVDAQPQAACINLDCGLSEAYRRKVDPIWPYFTLDRPTFYYGLGYQLFGLNSRVKTTVQNRAEQTIHRLLSQASLPAHLDRIVTELGGTLRDLLHREVGSLVHRAYTIQAALAALKERRHAQATQRQADIARLRDRTEDILAAGARLTVYLSR